jgi:hypothetical protein
LPCAALSRRRRAPPAPERGDESGGGVSAEPARRSTKHARELKDSLVACAFARVRAASPRRVGAAIAGGLEPSTMRCGVGGATRSRAGLFDGAGVGCDKARHGAS